MTEQMAENNDIEKKKKAEIAKQKSKNYSRTLGILTGLSLVAVGVGYSGNIFGFWSGFSLFFPGWWSLFIIIPCLAGIIERGLASPFTAGFIFGAVMLIMRVGLFSSAWKLFLPAVLIYGGILLIFRNRPFSYRRIFDTDSGLAFMMPIYRSFIIRKTVKIEDGFGGAEVTSWFAPVTLDLTKAKTADEAVIYAAAHFSPITIIVSPNINLRAVKVSGAAKLSVEAINYSDIINMPTLHVNAKCKFNSITVKN